MQILKIKTMSRNFNNVVIIRGLLNRNTTEQGVSCKQLVLPSRYKQQVLESLHEYVGHPVRDRTTSLVRERFY